MFLVLKSGGRGYFDGKITVSLFFGIDIGDLFNLVPWGCMCYICRSVGGFVTYRLI